MVVRVLVLASSSPRRKELLAEWGYDFKIISAPVDEELPQGIAPELAVLSLAESKARAGFSRWQAGEGRPGDVILAADTLVVLDGAVLGKPADPAEAVEMLLRLSGKAHSVLTGVALQDCARRESGVVKTEVRFRELFHPEIEAYVASGEPLDKAGAYGIQGQARYFVETLSGSLTNVIGLPMELVVERLKTWGIYQRDIAPREVEHGLPETQGSA